MISSLVCHFAPRVSRLSPRTNPLILAVAAASFSLSVAWTIPSALAQEILANPGYEIGYPGTTYSHNPEGTTSTWTAAGTNIANRILPNDWMIDDTGGAYESEWVELIGMGAGGSDHFIYVPNDTAVCVEPFASSMSAPLMAGTTYLLSVDLASADLAQDAILLSSLTTQALGGWSRLYTDNTLTTLLALDTSVAQLSGSGTSINGLNLGTISSTNLDALSFGWTNYQFTFTTPLSYWDSLTATQMSLSPGDAMTSISLDISNAAGGGGAFVVDNFSLQAIPEPSSALLVASLGLFAATRRKRRVVIG